MKNMFKNILSPYYNKIRSIKLKVSWTLFGEKLNDFFNVPIIINNFNRLTYLKKLIDSLNSRGYKNIFIIDNASTYPPLLEYYKICPYKIFRLSENIGYLSLWKTKLYKQFENKYFVYTDSDILIHVDCPNDFIYYFYTIMQRYKNVQKVGFGLLINDLPDTYKYKNEVIAWEKQYWQKEVEKNIYLANIDTTFALYRPFVKWGSNIYVDHFRTNYPYIAQHLPWYVNSNSMCDEDIYYINKVATSTHWSEKK